MKFLFSCIVFLAGFMQLSGSSYLQADTAVQTNAAKENFVYDLSQPHFDLAHSQNLELRIAEFEIEESDSVSKEKQNVATTTSILATQTSVPRCFYFKYKHLKTKARSSLSASVKPYLLFQVFRL